MARKEIKMTRTLTEIKVTYVKANFKTRSFDEVTDKVYITEDNVTREALAEYYGTSEDGIISVKRRKVKATWLMKDIISKADKESLGDWEEC